MIDRLELVQVRDNGRITPDLVIQTTIDLWRQLSALYFNIFASGGFTVWRIGTSGRSLCQRGLISQDGEQQEWDKA
jgi:hypothetical protein